MSQASDYARNVSDLYGQIGQARATEAANKGAIWGGAIATIGDVAGQALTGYFGKKAGDKKEQAWRDLFKRSQDAWDAQQQQPPAGSVGPELTQARPPRQSPFPTPTEILGTFGPHEGIPVINGLSAIHKLDPQAPAPVKLEQLQTIYKMLETVPDGLRAEKWPEVVGLLKQMGYLPKDLPDVPFTQTMFEGIGNTLKQAAKGEGFTLSEGQTRFDEAGNPLASTPKTAPPKADYTLGAQRFSGETNEVVATGEKSEAVITPYQQAQLDLARKRLDLAVKNANKPETDKAKSGLADAVMNHPELFAQLTPSEKGSIIGELDRRGFKDFKKPLSATMENRLASAKAVVQTGDDITVQLKDPKIAAMLGPAMGRYNNLREFIGDPPPELSELAGNVGSFALAQMGVHGMRNAEMAKQIEQMLDAKHTPESLAARINGINKFANHLLENEGRSAGPKVGDLKTFPNGNKGRWDGKGWELVK